MVRLHRAMLSLPAAGLIIVSLLGGVRSASEHAGDRRGLDLSGAYAQLACIEEEVERTTTPGQVVRIEAGGDPYLIQRVTELVYPRLRLTTDPNATVLVVDAASAGAATHPCGVEIRLVANGE